MQCHRQVFVSNKKNTINADFDPHKLWFLFYSAVIIDKYLRIGDEMSHCLFSCGRPLALEDD